MRSLIYISCPGAQLTESHEVRLLGRAGVNNSETHYADARRRRVCVQPGKVCSAF